jgi:cytochrome P450
MNPSSRTPLKAPPEPSAQVGLHALRAMWQQHTPLASLDVFHQALGDCFRVKLLGFRPVMLCGPAANHFVLVEARAALRWRADSDPIVRLLRHGVLVEDEQHAALRAQLSPALHKNMLAGYAQAMLRGVDQVCATWSAEAAPRDMLAEMRKVALRILFETLFAADVGPDLPTLWPSILRLLAYISPGAWMLWPRTSLPRTGYTRHLRQIDDYLYVLIAARRRALQAHTCEGADLLSTLIAAGMSDALMRDQLLTLLIAGHDTSTASLAWALYLLGAHPTVLAQARAEVDAVVGDATPGMQHLNSLTYLDSVVKEVLRMYPPVHLGSRIAAADLDFNGYGIPAGTRVVYSIYLTQRDPRYWPAPERFDPQRFAPGHTPHAPYTYLPFGGGPRNCLGYAFAEVELRLVLARLLQRFDFTLLPQPRIYAHMGATLEPHPGVWMTATPRLYP